MDKKNDGQFDLKKILKKKKIKNYLLIYYF